MRNERPRRDKTVLRVPVTLPSANSLSSSSLPFILSSAVSSFFRYFVCRGSPFVLVPPVGEGTSYKGIHENESVTSGEGFEEKGKRSDVLHSVLFGTDIAWFAFYIIFILLHFSRDKCLRGFASRLGKYFHNVLPCRPSPPPRPSRVPPPPLLSTAPSSARPRFAASLWFLPSPVCARVEQRNKITPTCAFVMSTERN